MGSPIKQVKTQVRRCLSIPVAFFLSLALGLPSPDGISLQLGRTTLRQLNAGMEESPTHQALQKIFAVPAAGLEEPVKLWDWDRESAPKVLSNGLLYSQIPRGGLLIPLEYFELLNATVVVPRKFAQEAVSAGTPRKVVDAAFGEISPTPRRGILPLLGFRDERSIQLLQRGRPVYLEGQVKILPRWDGSIVIQEIGETEGNVFVFASSSKKVQEALSYPYPPDVEEADRARVETIRQRSFSAEEIRVIQENVERLRAVVSAVFPEAEVKSHLEKGHIVLPVEAHSFVQPDGLLSNRWSLRDQILANEPVSLRSIAPTGGLDLRGISRKWPEEIRVLPAFSHLQGKYRFSDPVAAALIRWQEEVEIRGERADPEQVAEGPIASIHAAILKRVQEGGDVKRILVFETSGGVDQSLENIFKRWEGNVMDQYIEIANQLRQSNSSVRCLFFNGSLIFIPSVSAGQTPPLAGLEELDEPQLKKDNPYARSLRLLLNWSGFTSESRHRLLALKKIGPPLEAYIQGLLKNPRVHIAIVPLGSALKGYATAQSDVDYTIVILDGLDPAVRKLTKRTARQIENEAVQLIKKEGVLEREDMQHLSHLMGFTFLRNYSEITNSPKALGKSWFLLRDDDKWGMNCADVAFLFLPIAYGNPDLVEKARRNVIDALDQKSNHRNPVILGNNMVFDDSSFWWQLIQSSFRSYTYIDTRVIHREVASKPHLETWLAEQGINVDSEESLSAFRHSRSAIYLPGFHGMMQIYPRSPSRVHNAGMEENGLEAIDPEVLKTPDGLKEAPVPKQIVEVYAQPSVGAGALSLIPNDWRLGQVTALSEDAKTANAGLEEAARKAAQGRLVLVAVNVSAMKSLKLPPKAIVVVLNPATMGGVDWRAAAAYLGQPQRLFGLLMDLTTGSVLFMEIPSPASSEPLREAA